MLVILSSLVPSSCLDLSKAIPASLLPSICLSVAGRWGESWVNCRMGRWWGMTEILLICPHHPNLSPLPTPILPASHFSYGCAPPWLWFTKHLLPYGSSSLLLGYGNTVSTHLALRVLTFSSAISLWVPPVHLACLSTLPCLCKWSPHQISLFKPSKQIVFPARMLTVTLCFS